MDDGKRRQRYRVILIDLVVILYQYIAKIGDPIVAADVIAETRMWRARP